MDTNVSSMQGQSIFNTEDGKYIYKTTYVIATYFESSAQIFRAKWHPNYMIVRWDQSHVPQSVR
jgi:hypothetical protein